MKVLQEDVEHHADEEKKEIFKEARKLGDDRLEELGQQIQEREELVACLPRAQQFRGRVRH